MNLAYARATAAVIAIVAGVAGAAPPAAADDVAYLKHEFGLLATEGGIHTLQLVGGGLRSHMAAVDIEVDGVPLPDWQWDRTPGMATSSVGGVTVLATAVPFARLGYSTDFVRSDVLRDTVTVSGPMAVGVLRLVVDEGGPAARVTVRVKADHGYGQATRLRRGGVPRRSVPARAALWWAQGNGMGVAVEDSLIVMTNVAPDSLAGEGTATLEAFFQPPVEAPLELRLPVLPVDAERTPSLVYGGTDRLLEESRQFWRRTLAHGRIETSEPKVAATVQASLYHILAGSMVGGDRTLVLGGPVYYRQFYMRDSAFVVVALDRLGHHREARAGLEWMLACQTDIGHFVSQKGQLDGQGQALWALGEHLAITRDPAFARATLPAAARGVDWLRALLTRSTDAEFALLTRDDAYVGLMPASTINDAEQLLDGHVVGHNLWAYAGLAGAVEAARVAGATDSLHAWQEMLEAFAVELEEQIELTLSKNAGLLTPALEGRTALAAFPGAYGKSGGLDWGNLGVVFPTRFWRGDDTRARQNIDAWSERLREGLYPYPIGRNPHLVHHYLVTSVAHALLDSGRDADREHLFRIFYDGLLGHTTRTGGGSELINSATRDVWPYENIAPHNTFSARFLSLARDMLVREEGDTLVVGSGMSPAWMADQHRASVMRSATRFGWVSATLIASDADDGKRLSVRLRVFDEPQSLLVSGPSAVATSEFPIRVELPPRALTAWTVPAPLGFTIRAAVDSDGGAVGTVEDGGRRAVFDADVGDVELVLDGEIDPRFSVPASAERLAQ